jgi:hypothetical protein
MQLFMWTLTKAGRVSVPASTEAEKIAFAKQVKAQCEQLLYLSYKLQLSQLADKLHAFLWSNAYCGSQEAIMPSVFSDRVLDAAVGGNDMGREAWVRSCLSREVTLAAGSDCDLLRPYNLTSEQMQPIRFYAELQRDFMGTRKGAVVPVKLDLLGNQCISVGRSEDIPVRLSLGPDVRFG